MRTLGAAILVGLALVSASAAEDMLPVAPTSASTPFMYVQLLGGVNFGLDSTLYFGTTLAELDRTWFGYAQSATVGVNILDGLSVEADVLRSFRKEAWGAPNTYATVSFMGNVKYTALLNENYGLYAAAGVGYTWVNHFRGPPYDQDYTTSGPGYQLIAGGIINLTKNFAVVVEGRFQDSFENYPLPGIGNASVDVPVAVGLAGVKVSF